MVFKVNLLHASDRVPIGMSGGCTGAGGLAKRVDVHLRAYYRFCKPIAVHSNPAIKEG
jgi:hypothetical protein